MDEINKVDQATPKTLALKNKEVELFGHQFVVRFDIKEDDGNAYLRDIETRRIHTISVELLQMSGVL